MSTLEKAVELATAAHTGQVDKAGAPYISHPMRVMESVAGKAEKIAAMLHDIVEDTPVTLDDLAAAGFSKEVVAAVDALTKRQGESRMDAARRLAPNPIARAVKMADLRDNMNLKRIANVHQRDLDRVKEYQQVLDYLSNYSNAD